MTEKRYVFLPEPSKFIKVFDARNASLKAFTTIDEAMPDVMFKYCIDEFDKVKLFYINGKSPELAIDDFSYLNAKCKDHIRSLFGVNELAEFKLILDDDNPRAEFTLFYDVNGNNCSVYKLGELNKDRTILAHTYIYNVYKRYNLS